jgi:uncharacterized protein (UPF0332 family)
MVRHVRNVKYDVEEKIKDGRLRQTGIDHALVHGHFLKAYHDLEVMENLNRLNSEKPERWVSCPDWVVVSAYYGMYHAALAMLALKGWKSDDHDATIAMLKYIYVYQEGKLTLADVQKLEKAKTLLDEINKLAKAKVMRKDASYGVDFLEINVRDILRDARPFVERMRLLLKEELGYDLLSR